MNDARRRGMPEPWWRSVVFPALCLVVVACCLEAPGYAQSSDLVVAPVDFGNPVTLTGHHPAWASARNDRGIVPADVSLGPMELVLARSPQQQQAFDQFLAQQLDPSSPNYRHWLTPAEVGAQFGATQHDLDAITNWLESQNLSVASVANSRVRIRFSGPSSAVANAFGAQMHYYFVDGEQRFSIADEPQIPAALAGVIKSISGLYTLKAHPLYGSASVQVPVRKVAGDSQGGEVPDFTASSGAHYLFPSDFATIYDVNAGNINGAGVTIAIIGRSRVYAQDITNFESLAGLPSQVPTVIIPPGGVDPGPAETTPPAHGSASGDQGEATLDVTRSTSVAPGATIDLVVSAASGGGIETAAEYVADTTPAFAQIMSISFGGCESEAGQAGDDFWDSLFGQAAMEGISVFISSDDAGAAGCDTAFMTPPTTQQSLSINSICASSHATCMGGTEFADASNPNQYWATSNGSSFESALSYIPEGGWNEPESGNSPQVAASGGGFSVFIPTPSWQTGTGVPGTQGRYVPDMAFSSSAHDGYFACFAAAGSSCVVQNGSFSFEYFFGTSAAAPSMAGVTALLDQKLGAAQGSLNSNLYQLAATTSNNIFHDVTVASSAVSGCAVTTPSMCNNSIPSATSQSGGLSGYLVGTGYDEVTGLGSVDVAKLLDGWAGSSSTSTSTTTVISSLNPAFVGEAVTFAATVTSSGSGTPAGTVTFLDNGVSIGRGALNSGAVATLSTSALAVRTHAITAQYGGNSNFSGSTSIMLSEVVVNVKATTTTLGSSLNPSFVGQSVTFTATVSTTLGGTPTGAVTFLDGATPVGTGGLNAGGVATYSTTTLALGAQSITASYGGDANDATSTSQALNQTVSAVGFGPVSGAPTVTAGQSVVINLTLYAPSGYSLNFTLGCAGTPSKSSCVFAPNPASGLPGGQAIQLTFSTSRSELPGRPAKRAPQRPWGLPAGMGMGIFAVLAALGAALCDERMMGLWRVRGRRLAFGAWVAVIALATVLAGCGGSAGTSSTSTGSTGTPYTGTPKGLATFTVTGTSGQTTISTQVSVTVQ